MNKMWVNKDAKYPIILAIIVFSICDVIVFKDMIYRFKFGYNNNNLVFSIASSFSAGMSIFGVIIITGAVILLISILRIILLNNKNVKLNSMPYIKKYLNLELIPYKKNLISNNISVQPDFYYRDLPCNKDIKTVFWICYQYNLSDNPYGFIEAVLLDLILKNKISNISEEYLDLTMFNKFDYEYEAMLLDIF